MGRCFVVSLELRSCLEWMETDAWTSVSGSISSCRVPCFFWSTCSIVRMTQPTPCQCETMFLSAESETPSLLSVKELITRAVHSALLATHLKVNRQKFTEGDESCLASSRPRRRPARAVPCCGLRVRRARR